MVLNHVSKSWDDPTQAGYFWVNFSRVWGDSSFFQQHRSILAFGNMFCLEVQVPKLCPLVIGNPLHGSALMTILCFYLFWDFQGFAFSKQLFFKNSWPKIDQYYKYVLLLMEKIPNNHLGCIKPCKSSDKLPTSTGAVFLPTTVLSHFGANFPALSDQWWMEGEMLNSYTQMQTMGWQYFPSHFPSDLHLLEEQMRTFGRFRYARAASVQGSSTSNIRRDLATLHNAASFIPLSSLWFQSLGSDSLWTRRWRFCRQVEATELLG